LGNSSCYLNSTPPSYDNWGHLSNIHNWFWISTFRYTGNRLSIYCNWLHHLKIIWNVANSVKYFLKSNSITGNRLQEIGNRLPESKYSGNLEKFEKTLFVKQNCVMFGFWEIIFNTSLVNSSSLESWFFLMSFLESWNQLLLNLESSWCLFLNLEINLDLELVDSILTSFFWAFCHHQNYLIHTWFIIMKLASTIWMMHCWSIVNFTKDIGLNQFRLKQHGPSHLVKVNLEITHGHQQFSIFFCKLA